MYEVEIILPVITNLMKFLEKLYLHYAIRGEPVKIKDLDWGIADYPAPFIDDDTEILRVLGIINPDAYDTDLIKWVLLRDEDTTYEIIKNLFSDPYDLDSRYKAGMKILEVFSENIEKASM